MTRQVRAVWFYRRGGSEPRGGTCPLGSAGFSWRRAFLRWDERFQYRGFRQFCRIFRWWPLTRDEAVCFLALYERPLERFQLDLVLTCGGDWLAEQIIAQAKRRGIPVLASNRGALLETLQEAGFLFALPSQFTPQTRLVPTAEEVAPWIEMIIRLWDDEEFYQHERRRCMAAAEAWGPERLLPRFEEFFARVIYERSPGDHSTATIARRNQWPSPSHLPFCRVARNAVRRMRRAGSCSVTL
jgi:hypothetical protein